MFTNQHFVNMSNSATHPPTADAPSDVTVVTVSFDPAKLPENIRRDLEANSQLSRIQPADLIARILNKRIGPVFSVTPVHA